MRFYLLYCYKITSCIVKYLSDIKTMICKTRKATSPAEIVSLIEISANDLGWDWLSRFTQQLSNVSRQNLWIGLVHFDVFITAWQYIFLQLKD